MEYTESQVRRFLTTLFITRARNHLKRLAEIYNWSEATLAEHEERFLKTADFVPLIKI